jgi:potassium-transporting ATPase KdpC subunit
MRRDLVTAVLAVVVFTIVLGIGYPVGVWAIGQVAFHDRANGSQIHRDGKLVGSRLLGQAFTRRVNGHDQPDPRYFQSRPSQTGYNPAGTFFSNRGPNSSSAVYFYRDQLAAYLALERPYDPGLTAAGVPVDAVTTSASGVDPHISVANARVQAHRIAAVRHLRLARVNALIDDHTDDRSIGFLGETGVNVVELNLALDKEAPVS